MAKKVTLTAAELQVLDGIAHGLSTAEIGRAMHLSEYTVKDYVRRLYDKLGTRRNRGHVVAMGFLLGILPTVTDDIPMLIEVLSARRLKGHPSKEAHHVDPH